MADRRLLAGKPRRVLGVFTGFALVVAMSVYFTGCAGGPSRSSMFGLRGHTFESALKDTPQLARLAEALDETAEPPPSDSHRLRQLNLFANVFEITRNDYVDPVSDSAMIAAAVEGLTESANAAVGPDALSADKLIAAALSTMLNRLDPHSDYLTPDEYEEMQVRTRGQFGGLGIEVTMEDGLIKCVSPIDDTPAFRAGVLAGDLITHVDGEPVLGKTLSEAVDRMRGPVGTKITVTIRRAGVDEPFDLVIIRDIIRILSVRAHPEGDIGYLRITTFNESTEDGLYDAMASLRADIGDDMAGLVLDLRNNPGGLLDQALAVSDAFLSEGEIVSTAGRDHADTRQFTADREDIAAGLPMVVLINVGSASASEIVSGALQDNGRALVVGTRSFGKGSVQTITPVRGGGALRLTTARYYTPSGRSIQLTGIAPDIVAPAEPETGKREADLENALRAEGARTTLAAESMDAVCPSALLAEDTSLACALELLRGGYRPRTADTRLH